MMTDIQTWRRNTHLSASRIAELAGYGSSPEDFSLSTPPNEYARPRPRPRRSLASFASYLGAHRTASGSKSEWPFIDWSNLHDKEHVYRPDPDSMCTTLQRHVLNNPSNDLPAQYNSFLLHIMESYYRLKDDKKELERKLQAEEECHRADVDEFNLMIHSLLTTTEPNIPMTADLCFSNPTGDILPSPCEKTRKFNSKLDSLLSKFDTGYSRKPKRCAKGLGTQGSQGETTAPNQPNSLRSWSQCSGNGSAVVALGPNHHNFSPPSPHISTIRLGGSTASSIEGDQVSDEDYPGALTSIAVAAAEYSNKGRFHTQQFEYRNDWQSNAALSEPSDNRSSSTGARKDECSSTIAIVPPEPTTITTTLPDSSKARGLRRLRKGPQEDPGRLLDEVRLKRVHRRGFSFSPGDDTGEGHSKGLVSKSKSSPDRASTPLADNKEGKPKQDVSAKAASDSRRAMGNAPAPRPYPQFAKAVVSLTEEGKTGKLLHREGSAKSVLTAIKEGSSRSSSYSHQGSLGSSDGSVGLTGIQRGPGGNTFAVAAARAARKRQADLEGSINE